MSSFIPDSTGNTPTKGSGNGFLTVLPRLATFLIVVIVAIIGGIVTITHPETLSFANYVKAVATGGAGLAIGYGFDGNSTP